MNSQTLSGHCQCAFPFACSLSGLSHAEILAHPVESTLRRTQPSDASLDADARSTRTGTPHRTPPLTRSTHIYGLEAGSQAPATTPRGRAKEKGVLEAEARGGYERTRASERAQATRESLGPGKELGIAVSTAANQRNFALNPSKRDVELAMPRGSAQQKEKHGKQAKFFQGNANRFVRILNAPPNPFRLHPQIA